VKVLLHAGVDISLPGGVETHLRELARCLTARGHEVDLFARPVPYPPFRTVADFDPARYDVIHDHGYEWPRSLDVGGRYVRTLHFCVAAKMDTYVRLGRLQTLVNPANWRARACERAAIDRRGRVIAVSARVRDEFARHHGLDPARAVVIPNGVAFAKPSQSRDAWRASHGIAPGTPVLLTVGRRDFVKGTALLERAWVQVRARVPGALWVVAGGDAREVRPDRLTTGPIPHPDVLAWISAADVGALPSYYEGCSVALLEMLAGGLPALAHDVGNAAEVIEPNVNGALVPRDAAAWTSELVAAFGGASRTRAPALGPEYGWDAIAARVEAVYVGASAAAGTC
jgi:glycosyltransferase involved in cell wall biosynthesis